MEQMLAGLEDLLLYVFAFCALAGAALVVLLKQPMRVAMALISTMVFLGGIYGLLGVHFIAAFQVLIYVGAVMVFMVYVIMLLDERDRVFAGRFSALLWPGVAAALLVVAALAAGVTRQDVGVAANATAGTFGMQPFSAAFLNDFWLHFELVSLLLVAAAVAAIAVIAVVRRTRG
jgi:NADH-quinone oxidoreductase subunit J